MDALETCLRLSRVDAQVRRRLETQGLSFSDLSALYHLMNAEGGRMRRSELADRLGMTPSGVTRLLAPLEKLEYVAREADARDARRSLVVLTPAGRERTVEAVAVAAERAEWLLGRVLDDAERTSLGELLGRLVPGL